MSKNIEFWREIGASPWVLKVLEEGYAIPFLEMPPKVSFKNNKSSLNHPDFVSSEVLNLLDLGCVKEISRNDAHVISPLSVVDNGSKLRLILDLSYLNKFLSVPKFRYEDIRTIRDLFRKGYYFFKSDIKSGYHHINILETDHKYLAFSWVIDGVTRYFAFTVLVFGLVSAPFIFTKVVRIKHWRSNGILIFGFVDDIFGGSHSFRDTKRVSDMVKEDLFKSEFVVNELKSFWEPRQKGEHLGFIVDLSEGIFSVTPKRVQKFKNLLKALMETDLPTARFVAKIVGTIISMGLGLGPVTRMWTRKLYCDIAKAVSWNQRISLSTEALAELDFWQQCFDQYNGQPIWPVSPLTSVVTYSDVSALGWGGYSVNLNGFCAKGNFNEQEIGESSTFREL